MATILDQTLAKMSLEAHPLTICGECEQPRPLVRVGQHVIRTIMNKLSADRSVNDHEEVAYSKGFCGRQCHKARESRDHLYESLGKFATCPECKEPIASGKLFAFDGPLRARFCSDECHDGFDVRTALGRSHVIVVKGNHGYAYQEVCANGTLRGAEIVAQVLNVAPCVVFGVLLGGLGFDRWVELGGHHPGAIYMCRRMHAGKGLVGGAAWSDDVIAYGPGKQVWLT